MIKIKEEINEIRLKITNSRKIWSFEWINKSDKTLARLTKGKKTQVNKIRSEKKKILQ